MLVANCVLAPEREGGCRNEKNERKAIKKRRSK